MSDKAEALQPNAPVGDSLKGVARTILVNARAAIDNPERSDAEAVHQFRREMKRWRALLRLLAPYLGAEARRLRTKARDLARALGGARDAQAALDGIADVTDHGGIDLSERSLANLRKKVDEIRRSAEGTVLTADMRLRLVEALDDAEGSVDRWSLRGLRFAQISGRLAHGYRAARHAVPERWRAANAEDLHEFRKRIVNHRYQMETVAPLWPRFGKMWVGEAQRLRERLGKHQDLLVLARLIEPHQPLSRWRSRLAPAIAKRRAAHVRSARRIATRLLLDKPKAFRRRLAVMWKTG
jgi:CHAD domain-containing protein